MAHKQSKATKKFEKNKLKPTLERRKDFAKVKQRHQLKAKKKARGQSRAGNEDLQERSDRGGNRLVGSNDNLDDDTYFQQGIQVPESAGPTKHGKVFSNQQTCKRKRSREQGESDESAGGSEIAESEHTGLFDSEGE